MSAETKADEKTVPVAPAGAGALPAVAVPTMADLASMTLEIPPVYHEGDVQIDEDKFADEEEPTAGSGNSDSDDEDPEDKAIRLTTIELVQMCVGKTPVSCFCVGFSALTVSLFAGGGCDDQEEH
jgi:hypothetical protein